MDMEPIKKHNLTGEQYNNEVSIFDDVTGLPEYYSQRAINIFSILFSVLFGMVFLAMNLNQTAKGKKGVAAVIAFGILYTIAETIILELLSAGALLTLVFNGIGGYILSRIFWDTYIGRNVQYTKRPVVIAAVIGITIMILVTALLILAGNIL